MHSAGPNNTVGKSMDDTDRNLINHLQTGFPLVREPFLILGQELGITAEEVIRRTEGLKKEGVVRMIGPVINARMLGYRITLIAARVAEGNVDRAGRLLSEHSGVGHCYLREHSFNLWSTLSLPQIVDIKRELRRLQKITGADVVFDLPMVRTFKIGAYFDAVSEGCQTARNDNRYRSSAVDDSDITDTDRRLINELQNDLTLVQRPFDIVAARVEMQPEELLAACQLLVERGIIRRFAAAVRHQRVGYIANAMVCWNAPPDVLPVAAEKLSALSIVSHCYERSTNRHWPYNLFSMMHAYTRDTCYAAAEKVAGDTGLRDYVVLFSTREYKKERVNYRV